MAKTAGMSQTGAGTVNLSRIFTTWWPLAASWLLMSAELPAISAVLARLSDPEIHIASYGAVVFPISLIVEAPVIMLLAASTALSKDWSSYVKLRRYMHVMGGALTALHVLIAFTPLFDIIVEQVLQIPPQLIEPSRIGLMIMTPWTWSIAYRRFNQGVLIRYGQSKVVSFGTFLRLFADASILAMGYWIGSIPGIIVATSAVATGVLVEAAFVGLRVRPVLRDRLRKESEVEDHLTLKAFISFYSPLAATSLLMLSVQPACSAALSRMPGALASLAVWPVVGGLMFTMRSLGHAFQEVVVALLDEPGSEREIRRFAWGLTLLTTSLLTLLASTSLSAVWFVGVSGLVPKLGDLAGAAIWFGILLPGLCPLQNLYQGILVHRKQTRSITESVVVFLCVCGGLLLAGVKWAPFTGIYVALTAFSLGALSQVLWLAWRSAHPSTSNL
jgi:hypothetical protein